MLLAIQLPSNPVRFVDVSAHTGVTHAAISGDNDKKTYLIETLGTGLALIDYDNDGNLDLFTVNASQLKGFAKGQEPTNHLYRNTGDGRFIDITTPPDSRSPGGGRAFVRATSITTGSRICLLHIMVMMFFIETRAKARSKM